MFEKFLIPIGLVMISAIVYVSSAIGPDANRYPAQDSPEFYQDQYSWGQGQYK